jgi:hypothetical protein
LTAWVDHPVAKERLIDSFTEQYVTRLLDRWGAHISEVARTAAPAPTFTGG